MSLINLSPALWLLLGSAVLFSAPERYRPALSLSLPLLTLWHIWQIPAGHSVSTEFLGFTLAPVALNGFSRIFATVFSLAAFTGNLFALNQPRRLEVSAASLYAGSAIGVCFAGDLITLFIFWEIMAVGSTLVIWSAGTPAAKAAGMRYAALHFIGGAVLMAGIAAQVADSGSVALPQLLVSWDTTSPALWLFLIGVLINAGAPPFSAWLPDAYPEASPSGMVFLSAFTTKTAVYVLLTLFAGSPVLIYVGLFMVFYGIIYAILENDMRRILAYSIINQVGFMITGIGIGTEMALYGAAAHAFCHIIYKALLLMSAGSVMFMTGKRKCSDLGGLYHSMPLTAIAGIIGALAISAFPLTSGFISKSLISEAAAHQHLAWVWLLLTAASAGTFLYVSMKISWFVFFGKDAGLRPSEPPRNMLLAMGFFSALCIIPGLFSQTVYFMLPGPVEYQPNTALHFVTQLQLLLFSGLAFFLMLPLLKRTLTISLDFDWLYRVAMLKLLLLMEKLGNLVIVNLEHASHWLTRQSCRYLYHIHGTRLGVSRSQAIGTTALWIAAMLGTFLALS